MTDEDEKKEERRKRYFELRSKKLRKRRPVKRWFETDRFCYTEPGQFIVTDGPIPKDFLRPSVESMLKENQTDE